jgi:hypothetical protein
LVYLPFGVSALNLLTLLGLLINTRRIFISNSINESLAKTVTVSYAFIGF